MDPDGNWIINTNLYMTDKYFQNDSRWSNLYLSGIPANKELGKTGCAVTVIANGATSLMNHIYLHEIGATVIGLNPEVVNNIMTSEVGANFEKFADWIESQGYSTTLTDTASVEKVKNAATSSKATLIFAHMQTEGTEGEHWININGVNSDGTFNGSDVLMGENGKEHTDYSRSLNTDFDRFIIIEVDLN